MYQPLGPPDALSGPSMGEHFYEGRRSAVLVGTVTVTRRCLLCPRPAQVPFAGWPAGPCSGPGRPGMTPSRSGPVRSGPSGPVGGPGPPRPWSGPGSGQRTAASRCRDGRSAAAAAADRLKVIVGAAERRAGPASPPARRPQTAGTALWPAPSSRPLTHIVPERSRAAATVTGDGVS